MARSPMTRALQLLLALGWILEGQSNLTILSFPLMNKDALNGVEDSDPVMTGGPPNLHWRPQLAILTIKDSLPPAPGVFIMLQELPDNQMNSIFIWGALMNSIFIWKNRTDSIFIWNNQTNSISIWDNQTNSISNCDSLLKCSFILMIVVPVLYSVAFLVGLPANILALWVLIFHTQKAPSTILLINLTVLDVLLLLMLPFRIIYYFAGLNWFFGVPMCQLVIALLYGSMYGSVLTLALISIDRYIALVHPYSALTLRSHRTSLAMSVSLWVMVLLTMMLQFFFQLTFSPPFSTNIALCYDAPLSFFFPFLGLLWFFLPLLVILFCHGTILKTLLARGHHYSHAACLTALVLLVFLACFLPNIIILFLYLTNGNCNLIVSYIISLAFSCFGPCIDPFIYNYVSDDFRGKVLRVLSCCCAGQQVSSNTSGIHLSSSSQSRSTLLSKFWGQMKIFCPEMCQEV